MSKPFHRPAGWKADLPAASTGFEFTKKTRQIYRATLRTIGYLNIREEFSLPRRIARAIVRRRVQMKYQKERGSR